MPGNAAPLLLTGPGDAGLRRHLFALPRGDTAIDVVKVPGVSFPPRPPGSCCISRLMFAPRCKRRRRRGGGRSGRVLRAFQ